MLGLWLDFSSLNDSMVPFARTWKLLCEMGFQSQAKLVFLLQALNGTHCMRLEVVLEMCSSVGHFPHTPCGRGKARRAEENLCADPVGSPNSFLVLGFFFLFVIRNLQLKVPAAKPVDDTWAEGAVSSRESCTRLWELPAL